jgi:hypothetical protein
VPDVKDLVMWVGAKPYPTWRSFADEAKARGVCKRVRSVPKGITSGQSRVFLIHGERVTEKIRILRHSFRKANGICRYCGLSETEHSQTLKPCVERVVTRTGKPLAFIYGYFTVSDVLVVTNDPKSAEKYMKAYPEMDFCFKSTEQAATEQDRGCGRLKNEAIYLRGPLAEFKDLIPWSGPAFVGYRYFDANTFGFAYLQEPVRVEKAVSVQGSL